MKKKYIIDLNPDCVEGEYLRIPARIAGEEQWLVTKAALTPYAAPDLGQVRKEAYKIGYEKGHRDGVNRIGDAEDKIRKEAYEKGLSDAWEAARKICTNWVLPDSVLSEIFGMDKTIDDIMKENTASEVIAKIQAYEQGKEEIIDPDKNKVEALANDIGIHKLFALVKEIRGE